MSARRTALGGGLVIIATLWLGLETGTSCESCRDPGWQRLSTLQVPAAESCQPAVSCPVAPPCPLAVPGPPPMPAVVPPQPEDPPVPIVVVRVRVPATAAAGEELEYHICVENCSPAAAHHVLVRNPLPANAQFVRACPEPTRRVPDIQWELGTLKGGQRRNIILTLHALGGTDIDNCTRVQFEHGQCVTTRIAGSAPAVPQPPGKQPAVQPPAVQPPAAKPPVQPPAGAGQAKLSLSMTGPEKQYLNLPAQYFITATNTGTAPATNVLISDQVPAQMAFVSAGQKGAFVANQVAWLLGTLQPGESKTVDVSLRAQAAGEICNRATVAADGGLHAEAKACTTFQAKQSALLLEMYDRKDPIAVGGETSYPIVVLNQGGVPITNIRIKALLPDALVLTAASGPTAYKPGVKTPDGYQTILFDPLASLAPGAKAEFEVFVKSVRAADVRFQIEMTADQLTGGPVIEQESTTIFEAR